MGNAHASDGSVVRTRHPGRRYFGFHSMPRCVPDPGFTGRRKVGHDREPDTESIHDSAGLVLRLGGLAGSDGGGDVAAGCVGAANRRGAVVKRSGVGLSVYALAVFLFLHLPLLILASFSFNASRFTVWQGFSLRWYTAALQDSQLIEASWNSLIIATVATVVSTIIGTLCAYGLWKRSAPVLTGSLYLSLVTPEIVTGISLLAFYQWIFRFLHVQLGMHTVILAHISFSI